MLLLTVLGFGNVILANDAEAPTLDLLEYLGSWEESDEDWILLAERAKARLAADESRNDTAPRGEDTVENDDES